MKARINIRRYLEEHAPQVASHLFSSHALPDIAEFDIDIDRLLVENDLVGLIWCIDDVKEMRPDLSDEQCLDVLYAARDCETGISHDSISILADDLYGRQTDARWHGRIDVSVANYDRDAAIEHFEGMADHVESKSVNSTTTATFDPSSLRLVTSDAKEPA
jgi:hypothetical protein